MKWDHATKEKLIQINAEGKNAARFLVAIHQIV